MFDLELEKCATRYSGHLFSRLAVYVPQHDQTNPVSYFMKGKPEQSFKLNVFYARLMKVWVSKVCTFVIIEVERKYFLSSTPQNWWDDWLILDRVIDVPV